MQNKEFFEALADLVKEKGISEEEFLETLKNALTSAYKRQFEDGAEIFADIDAEAGKIEFRAVQKVVETVENPDKEISVEDAREIDPEYRAGDEIVRVFEPKSFDRIAAQIAKQVIMQKIHEVERDSTYSAFSDKEGELMVGTVRRIEEKGISVELSDKKIDGMMLPQDQIPTEKYAVGNTLKVYVRKVRTSGRNAQILVSRSASGLVRKLFEEQVPEIKTGAVEIKAITREAGYRTKMAILSTDERVDAIGACVGNKGARVNAVVEELGGEKIDILLWSENPLEFIAKALSPATVISVTETGEKSAIAVVPDDKLSLAIGRNGQNARLAARLTGWKIDVKSETVAREMHLGAEEAEEGAEVAEETEATGEEQP